MLLHVRCGQMRIEMSAVRGVGLRLLRRLSPGLRLRLIVMSIVRVRIVQRLLHHRLLHRRWLLRLLLLLHLLCEPIVLALRMRRERLLLLLWNRRSLRKDHPLPACILLLVHGMIVDKQGAPP